MATSDSLAAIGDEAFIGCDALTEITLPASLERMGNAVFAGCKSLFHAVIPDKTVQFGKNLFADCVSLEGFAVKGDELRVKTENGVLYTADGSVLIAYPCGKKDECFTVPRGVNRINGYAFYGNKRVASAVIPDTVTVIGDHAFQCCLALSQIEIPSSVTSIGEGAFRECFCLGEVTVPPSVTVIKRETFNRCAGLKTVTLPDTVTAIGDYAFDHCAALTEIRLPEGLTAIGKGAFQYCMRLTELVIPDSVTHLGGETFLGCKRLTAVTVPDSPLVISSGLFEGCEAFREFRVEEGNRFFGLRDGMLLSADGRKVIAYPFGRRNQRVVIAEGVETIAAGTFNGCDFIKEVYMPDTVTHIGEGAFWGCYRVEYIRLSRNTVTKLKKLFGELSYDPEYLSVSPECFKELELQYKYCAAKTVLQSWADGELTQAEHFAYAKAFCGSLAKLLDYLGENVELYRFVTRCSALTRYKAKKLLERTDSIECRAILLEYLQGLNLK